MMFGKVKKIKKDLELKETTLVDIKQIDKKIKENDKELKAFL